MFRRSKLAVFEQRKFFDPENPRDLQELKFFVENGRWRNTCPFYLEDPWEDIPIMCKDKFTSHMLSKVAI